MKKSSSAHLPFSSQIDILPKTKKSLITMYYSSQTGPQHMNIAEAKNTAK